jgi:hypothetical protein
MQIRQLSRYSILYERVGLLNRYVALGYSPYLERDEILLFDVPVRRFTDAAINAQGRPFLDFLDIIGNFPGDVLTILYRISSCHRSRNRPQD